MPWRFVRYRPGRFFSAVAIFCSWLTHRWQEQGWLPAGWRVDPPSEPEWEKAARGGEKIPVSEISPFEPSMIIQALTENWDLTANPLAKRIFPWGDGDSDLAECMNFYDSNIDSVSPAGCYPEGSSPYGCEDLSGNVWELTRSRFHHFLILKTRNRGGSASRENLSRYACRAAGRFSIVGAAIAVLPGSTLIPRVVTASSGFEWCCSHYL